jgi:hypothetical protein
MSQTEHFTVGRNPNGHAQGGNYIGHLFPYFQLEKKKKKKVGLELTYIYIVAFILMSRYDSNPTFKVGKFSYDLGTQHEIIELGFEGFDRPV